MVAIRDPLTGLYNRRYLDETLDRELARAARENYTVSFMVSDIDHFKKVNDTYGHHAGDLVLKNLANSLPLPMWKTSLDSLMVSMGHNSWTIWESKLSTPEVSFLPRR